jgi:hypothetical protein
MNTYHQLPQGKQARPRCTSPYPLPTTGTRDEGTSDYVVPHTAMTYVLDPAGRFIDHWPDSLDEEAVVLRLGKLLI